MLLTNPNSHGRFGSWGNFQSLLEDAVGVGVGVGIGIVEDEEEEDADEEEEEEESMTLEDDVEPSKIISNSSIFSCTHSGGSRFSP